MAKVPSPKNIPLCIDLDGTLIQEDVTQIAVWRYLKHNPLRGVTVLLWLLRGRALLKKKLGERVEIDVSGLSYNPKVTALIRDAKLKGHSVVLATAADARIAHKIAHYCGFFDHIIASDGFLNQRAAQKAETLIKTYGEKNFIYVGNSKDDLKVWQHAHRAVAVNVSCSVARKLKNLSVFSEILS
ncbi:MAG TPA: hypothetical protein PLY23_03825 [Alphaproteobacteria bacterium]|nr:hypothetical protein [Alphaproteobacteria bacterium]HQS93632.1 hypothetical protein [Alphaproteobacteria bacterium]